LIVDPGRFKLILASLNIHKKTYLRFLRTEKLVCSVACKKRDEPFVVDCYSKCWIDFINTLHILFSEIGSQRLMLFDFFHWNGLIKPMKTKSSAL